MVRRSPGTRTRSRGRGRRRCSMSGWVTCGRSKGLRRSTIRSYALAISAFCRYLTDPAYGWAAECQVRFGTHPVQVCHEWNTAVHVQQAEGDPLKRAFTVDELQAFFDHADEQVRRVRGGGPQGLAAGVPGRGAVQGRLRVRAAPHRGPDARPGRLGHQPARRRVRRVRLVPGAVRQGQPGITAQAAQRADRLAVAARGAGAVDRGGPPAVRRGGGLAGVVALRARAAGRGQRAEQAVRPSPGTRSAWPPGWTSTRCAAPM